MLFGDESYDSDSSFEVKEEENPAALYKRKRPLRVLTERQIQDKLDELVANPASDRVIANMTLSTYQRFIQKEEEIEDDEPGIFSECRLKFYPEDFDMWKRYQNKKITAR